MNAFGIPVVPKDAVNNCLRSAEFSHVPNAANGFEPIVFNIVSHQNTFRLKEKKSVRGSEKEGQ